MMACFTFGSLGQVQTPDFTLNFTSLGFSYEGEATDGAPTGTFLSTWYFFILSLTTTVLLLIDIFLYRSLRLQKKVCLICWLLIIASVATCGCLGYNAVTTMQQIDWSSLALVAPVFALFAAIMAYYRMKSDENKLRAADRIR